MGLIRSSSLDSSRPEAPCTHSSPSRYRTLLRTIDKGKLSNVAPLQLALAEAVGKREMVLPGSDLSAHALGRFYPRESGPREVVPVESLDHLCSSGNVPIPRFIKCDVEGFPDVVLEGAKELIRHHRPTWLIELWNDEEIGYACDPGYTAFYYRDGDIHETTRSVENIGEYFLFPR